MIIFDRICEPEQMFAGATLQKVACASKARNKTVSDQLTIRVHVLILATLSLVDFAIHAGAAVEKLAIAAVQLPLHRVWDGMPAKPALSEAREHFANAGKSLAAGLLVPVPALASPEFAVTAYQWLSLAQASEKGILSAIAKRVNATLLVLSTGTAALASYSYLRKRAVASPFGPFALPCAVLGAVALLGLAIRCRHAFAWRLLRRQANAAGRSRPPPPQREVPPPPRPAVPQRPPTPQGMVAVREMRDSELPVVGTQAEYYCLRTGQWVNGTITAVTFGELLGNVSGWVVTTAQGERVTLPRSRSRVRAAASDANVEFVPIVSLPQPPPQRPATNTTNHPVVTLLAAAAPAVAEVPSPDRHLRPLAPDEVLQLKHGSIVHWKEPGGWRCEPITVVEKTTPPTCVFIVKGQAVTKVKITDMYVDRRTWDPEPGAQVL
jgi:hypothetical protein